MATLNSPGVSVEVINESFYAPADAGTIPLLFVSSAENKLNGGGSIVAPGTLKENAGQVYLLTSQKDLVDTFGDPVFKTDANNNPIHAGEQNEYGLHAAYSYLGVSNRAYVARADVDLNQLTASSDAPSNVPENGTYWFDTQNTFFGIFEWNGNPVTVRGGQTYTNKVPVVVEDVTKVENYEGGDYRPKTSIGTFGDYAIVTLTNANELYFKNRAGDWVLVGSNDWSKSWPTVSGTKSVSSLVSGSTFYVNGELITCGVDLNSVVSEINNKQIYGGAITAENVNNKLEIYNNGSFSNNSIDSTVGDSILITAGTGNLVAGSAVDSILGIAVGTYYNPKLTISKHTQTPEYKRKNTNPRPTGSLWIKTTQSNMGARWRMKRFNGVTKLWENIETGLYPNSQSAIFAMDKVGGGFNIPIGDLYINYNFDEHNGIDETPNAANFKIMRRTAVGETTIRTNKIQVGTLLTGNTTFIISESVLGSAVLGDYEKTGVYQSKEVSFIATSTPDDADLMASAINSANFVNVRAEVDSLKRVIIKHRLGGEFRLKDGQGQPLLNVGFVEYDFDTKYGTLNLNRAPDGDVLHDFVASLWSPLVYTAGTEEPTSLTPDGMLWYSSVIDEVDLLIHDGNHWVGYQNPTSPYYSYEDTEKTDPLGPVVSASTPEVQSDGSPLVTGDIWIDTSDIENFPVIYKFNAEFENKPIKNRWVLIDKTDQSTEDGILFADARYNTSGENSNVPGNIIDLLVSDFVDFDAPDPVLYPKGMILWNLRRSGFNVKRFVQNYIKTEDDNERYGAAPVYSGESMEYYYPHRWVTESGNQEDGSGTFGRKAQRKVVVQSIQALVNSNQLIRDEETRVFNLMACPGYPELIGEMIALNYDRGLTAFIVGDTPARLTSDATSLQNWATNQRLAVEDNDLGGASYDEYMGMFYPWGYTSDNFGNNVVVPPSHMVLRTIALNDQVAYPWFAPAGVRRGGITNATAVGYIDGEGEFKSISLNEGQRDTLYDGKVNPITFFNGSGLMLWGQKTRAKAASALDRINVARLVIYLRRRLALAAKPFIFEPNDKITRDEMKATVESIMLELVGQRAIYDYLVVCSEVNNTPARIDRNELYVDIAISPVKSVEMIYIPLRLKNTGEISGS